MELPANKGCEVGQMKITVLGAHNSETSYSRCISIMVDNKIVVDAGGLTAALSMESQHGIQALLITHGHYDHTRDIPNLAMNFDIHMRLYHSTEQLNLYATAPVREWLMEYLLNGKIYPNFTKRPENNPALRFNIIEPDRPETIGGYRVLPVSVSHPIPTVGYQITGAGDATVFYTGDTGQGLTECWRKTGTPQLIITETTLNNEREEEAAGHGHLTPNLLKRELSIFRDMKGYLPRILLVHMTPELEDDIKFEIEAVAKELDARIDLAYEGMQVDV